MDGVADSTNSGRVCPLDYHYTPDSLAAMPTTTTDTLYVVGGLYGNPFALKEVEKLLATENARCIFNGDFNWFNYSETGFLSVNETVLQHDCIRGNVETEIARRPFAGGCGCGYPSSVSDNVVDWSNSIIAQLNKTASNHKQLQSTLQALPVSKRYFIGDTNVQVLHGDCRSLAGWSLSRENLTVENLSDSPATIKDLVNCKAQIIASTHTCEPIATTLTRTLADIPHDIAVINNGAAGMPNFNHDLFGVVSRISINRAPMATLYGRKLDNVYIDAVALKYSQSAFLEWFLDHWPEGSAAYMSYYERLSNGPKTAIADSTGIGFSI